MDVLTIEHLTKKIGNKTILDDVSFKLKRGTNSWSCWSRMVQVKQL